MFTADMNQQVFSETTQTGTVVYTLVASPVESSATNGDRSSINATNNIRYFIRGTEVFVVNETSGEVTLSQRLDREVRKPLFSCISTLNCCVETSDIDSCLMFQTTDSIKLMVGASDGSNSSGATVEIPIAVIVSDENDNPPTFSQVRMDGLPRRRGQSNLLIEFNRMFF